MELGDARLYLLELNLRLFIRPLELEQILLESAELGLIVLELVLQLSTPTLEPLIQNSELVALIVKPPGLLLSLVQFVLDCMPVALAFVLGIAKSSLQVFVLLHQYFVLEGHLRLSIACLDELLMSFIQLLAHHPQLRL